MQHSILEQPNDVSCVSCLIGAPQSEVPSVYPPPRAVPLWMTNGLGKDIEFESAFHRSMDRSKRLLLEVLQSSFAVPCEALQPPHTASFCILLWKCRSFCERRHAWQTIASPY